ncbi:phosphatidylcholine-sterol acyltransferase isoform X2 [Heterodontus francisci]|uniref:phosphatidylcholine-sterol acyltransferase isoform X2 n=1 Tax=Heterodontus francisci TaxID=7792 RepID=UPI00355BD1B8
MRNLPRLSFVLSLILVLLSIQLSTTDSTTLWLVDVLFPPIGPEDTNLKQSELPPLVIVPGHVGNRLEAKLNKPALVHWLCMKRSSRYFTLWLNLNMFLPIGIDCWIDNIRLVYNRTTKRTSNSPGVETRVPGFGKTYSVEYLDPLEVAGYLHTFVQFMVNTGYIRDETVRAAPYDWRVAAWDNYGLAVDLLKIREQQRTTTTNPWLLPTTRAWPTDHVFVSTPTYNYTYNDYRKFFADIGYEDGWLKWQNSKGLLSDLPPPGVNMYCLYGTGIPTPVTYIYDEDFPSSQPIQIVYGDGDNTVGIKSLSLCRKWKEQQKQKVHVIEFPGKCHFDIIYDFQALEVIQDILLGNYSEQQLNSRN